MILYYLPIVGIAFIYFIYFVLTEKMAEKSSKTGNAVRNMVIIVGVIASIATISITWLTIYYNFLPEMVWHSQLNGVTCPPSLINNSQAYVNLTNIGEVPANFYVNFFSSYAIFTYLGKSVYTTNRGTVVIAKENQTFGIIPNLTNVHTNFTVEIDANCNAEQLWCRHSANLVLCCSYKTPNWQGVSGLYTEKYASC